MATTTNKGYFELRTSNTSMIDYDYMNYIDIDDDTRFDLATFMMVNGESRSTGTPEFFGWAGQMTDRVFSGSDTTGLATDGTQLFLDAAAPGIRVGDVLHLPTAGEDGDHVRVTAISGATLDIADLNTRTAAIATDQNWILLGEAAAFSASSSATATYREPDKITNYTQLIRRTVSWDETELASDVETQASRREQKSSWLRKEFRKDMGFTFWFARSSQDATVTTGYQTSKGIVEQLANNVTGTNEGGAFTYESVSAQLEEMALYSKSSKLEGFHGAKALGGLADLGTTARIGNQDRKGPYGYAGQTIDVSDFSVRCRYDRILHEAGSVYTATFWLLDMAQLWLYHLNGKKFIYERSVEADPGGEIVVDQMKTNSGLALNWAKRHGWIYGIT